MDKQKVIEFFDKHSETWDANMICDDKKMNMIMDYAQIKKGISVLDIACGTGVMFDYYLARGVGEITGVDISPKMVEIAGKKFANNKNVSVFCADAETENFTGQYDCCMVFNAFPHFVNPEALIDNLYRAVKTGGTLTIAHDRGRRALDIHHSGEANPISRGLMSEKELQKMFLSAGFSNVQAYATEDIYIVAGIKISS